MVVRRSSSVAGSAGAGKSKPAAVRTNDGEESARLGAALARDVPALLRAIAGSAVEEVRLEHRGVRLSLRRALPAAPTAATPTGEGLALGATPVPEAVTGPRLVEVTSAHVGIFHRSREPDGPPMAEEGTHVEEGRSIGVIETLGMSAEVEVPAGGRLVEVRAEDGQPVEYGQVLAVIQAD